MRRKRNKQTFKLRLLAFVLALALVWYSLNPAPRPVSRRKPKEDPPDEKKQGLEPLDVEAALSAALKPSGQAAWASPTPDEDEDDFDWPEFIDG